jgi:hypothetical protein
VGQGAQTAELYDFLYRDSDRIVSYYAQIFGGHVASIEKTDSVRTTQERSGTASISILGGNLKNLEDVCNALKTTVNPHDLVTTDVLTELRANGRLRDNAEDASGGELFIEKGRLSLIDGSFLKLASTAVGAMVKAGAMKGIEQQNPTLMQFLPYVEQIFDALAIPPAFLFQSDGGRKIAGTIKETGLEERIASYHFKYGGNALADVYLVGVKEVVSMIESENETNLFSMAQAGGTALANLLFPEGALRATPIAIFRKL